MPKIIIHLAGELSNQTTGFGNQFWPNSAFGPVESRQESNRSWTIT